ncbi:hypothetical protein RUM44_009076 [Polyplax serrata]|uniref:Immunoglobulin I-set domain-containing protein n=1 Tax=Polyplax serrata TaxID=468196 RepID=A0ABR1ARP2_POLSC
MYLNLGSKYEPQLVDNAYKVHMKLIIKSVSPSDFGTYKCVSKNSLGHTDGSIKLYQVTKEISHRTRNKGRKHESNEIGLDVTGEYKESGDNEIDSPEAEESTGSSSSPSPIQLSHFLKTTAIVVLWLLRYTTTT